MLLAVTLQTPTMRPTASSTAPRSPTSGVGIVWRVARAQGVPNDILVIYPIPVLFVYAPTHAQTTSKMALGIAAECANSHMFSSVILEVLLDACLGTTRWQLTKADNAGSGCIRPEQQRC